MRIRKKPSQTELATEPGITQALVSDALKGRGAGINPETCKHAREHAVGLGCRPKGRRVESTPDAARTRHVIVINFSGHPTAR